MKNYFHKLRNFFFFLFLSSCFSSAIYAKELLILRGDGDYPPNEFSNNGKVEGLHVDILKSVMARLHQPYRLESYPWARAVNMITAGTADAITYIGKNPEREKFIWYDKSVISESPFCFWILASNKDKITFDGDVAALAKRTPILGVILGYSYKSVITNSNFKLDVAKSELATVEKLLHGRIPMNVGERFAMEKILKKEGIRDKFIALTPDVYHNDNYLGFSKKLKQILQQQEEAKKNSKMFSDELEKFKNTEEYKKLLAKYN